MKPFLPKPVAVKAPPIKIQGIKTKLVPFIASVSSWNGKGRWIEPFMGSCSVALNLAPKSALLCDTNEHVIRFYQQIQSGEITAATVRQHLEDEGAKLLALGESHFYEIRRRFNETKHPLDLLFLNRSCFNGIMRFNKKGGFNVPFCRKPERFRGALITKICNQVTWAAAVMRGKEWTFVCQSWRETLRNVNDADFVYFDPPYAGRHTDYYNQWSDEEANELANSVRNLTCGFAYSMWLENKYRTNEHLANHFSEFPMETVSHFYHVGASESLRNEMKEALVLSPKSVAEPSMRPPPVLPKVDEDFTEQLELV